MVVSYFIINRLTLLSFVITVHHIILLYCLGLGTHFLYCVDDETLLWESISCYSVEIFWFYNCTDWTNGINLLVFGRFRQRETENVYVYISAEIA